MTTKTLEVMKRNPLRSALATIASVAAVVIFIWAVDDRYVSASDFEQYQQQIQESIRALDRRQLENRLLELNLKVESGIATPIERTIRAHIQRQLQSLQ